MTNIKGFRRANSITQKSLADYLNVTPSAISQWETGLTNISMDCFEKLLNNDKGWDVSMLTAPQGNIYNNASGSGTNTNNVNIGNTQALQAKIEMLEQQLAEEKARSSEYWELLKDAIKKSREQ